MISVAPALAFPAMARKEPGTKTDQVNFRFPIPFIERLEKYKERHPLHPTVTNILIAAGTEWLDKHEPQLPPEAAKPKR